MGRRMNFSISGGGFISFEHLVETLGIARTEQNVVDGGDSTGCITEDSVESNVGGAEIESAVEVEANTELTDPETCTDSNSKTDAVVAVYEDSISLNKTPVSESTKKFAADVASVEFSTPDLVWVGKVDTESLIGDLKKENGLEI